MQKILIDCRFAATHSGLGRYSRSIAKELLALGGMDYQLLVRSKNEVWIPENASVIEADIPHYSLAEQTTLPRIIASSGADMFFSPHFNVPLNCPVPFIVTIHDLILHRYPNHSSFIKRFAYKMLVKHAVDRAKKIIAVSDFTKSEILKTYGSKIGSKTTVILEGVDEQYRPATSDAIQSLRSVHNLHKPFLLYVGNAKEHKNVRMLIDAFVQSGRGATHELVLLTGGPEAARLEPLPSGVRCIRDVSDETLPVLYSAADALVTASLYEGFCLPVAEALACGCPVIASNATAIPQIASGKATLVEPTLDAFTQALASIPDRPASYRIAEWKDAAKATLEILRAL